MSTDAEKIAQIATLILGAEERGEGAVGLWKLRPLIFAEPDPVVTLTPEEVATLRWFFEQSVVDLLFREGHDLRALVARLEASS